MPASPREAVRRAPGTTSPTALGARKLWPISQVCVRKGSGFRVQHLKVSVLPQVLNLELPTLNPTTEGACRSEAQPR